MTEHIIDVLLIDDDQVDCELIKRLLKKTMFNYRLEVFHDGISAINYLDRQVNINQKTLSYLIMLDINIPAMNGFQILEKIQGFGDNIQCKIYIFTTSNNSHDRQKAVFLGIENYFLKQDLNFDENLLNCMMEDFLTKFDISN